MKWCLVWALLLCCGPALAGQPLGNVESGLDSGLDSDSDSIYFRKSGDGRGYFLGVNPSFATVRRSGRAPSLLRSPLRADEGQGPYPTLHLRCRAGPLEQSKLDSVSPLGGYVQIRPWEEDPRARNIVDPADWLPILLSRRFGLRAPPPYFQAEGALTIARGDAMYTIETQIRRDSEAYSTETFFEILFAGQTAVALTETALSGRGDFLTLDFAAEPAFELEAGYRMSHRLREILSEMAERCPARQALR